MRAIRSSHGEGRNGISSFLSPIHFDGSPHDDFLNVEKAASPTSPLEISFAKTLSHHPEELFKNL